MTKATTKRTTQELTADILLDEERMRAREREAKRLEELEAISPACTQEYEIDGEDRKCTDKLNVHEPCSKCPCPAYRGPGGESAAEMAEKITAKHPALFQPTTPRAKRGTAKETRQKPN